jgi:hypothetical protein
VDPEALSKKIAEERDRLSAADDFIAETRRSIKEWKSHMPAAGPERRDAQAVLRNLGSTLKTVVDYRRGVAGRLARLKRSGASPAG